jgi:hypothetical protein
VQAVGPLLEAQFGIDAQQNDSSHPFTAGRLRERPPVSSDCSRKLSLRDSSRLDTAKKHVC